MLNAKPMILGRFLQVLFDTTQLDNTFLLVSFGGNRLMNINAVPTPATNNADIHFLALP